MSRFERSKFPSERGQLPGIPHLKAVRAVEKAGLRVVRQSKHIVRSNGVRILTSPRNNPVNGYTMGGIVRDAGLTIEQFRISIGTLVIVKK